MDGKRNKVVVILCMLLCICNINLTAIASEVNPWLGGGMGSADIEFEIPHNQEKAIDVLCGLGIIDDALYIKEIANEPLTRIEAAEILYKFSGVENVGGVIKNGEAIFDDIKSSEVLEYIVGEKNNAGSG